MPNIANLNNFVIDRPTRGMMLNTDTGAIEWTINQISDPTLSISTDKVDAVDALGAKIMTFERAKNAEFSCSNSLFDMGLYAAQAGTEKQIASTASKILTPAFEEIEVNGATIALKHTPKGQIPYIYALNDDSTLGTTYKNGSAATATQFVHADGSKSITVPSGLANGDILFVEYEYEAEAAVMVENSGTNFPKAGKFILEVLGCDLCNPSLLYRAYIVFPNAKLVSDVEITFNTEGQHPLTLQAMTDYCSKTKRLMSIIVPEEQ